MTKQRLAEIEAGFEQGDQYADGHIPEMVDAVRDAQDAAQQLFEATVRDYNGDSRMKATYISSLLSRWPWLRPNPYQKAEGGDGQATPEG